MQFFSRRPRQPVRRPRRLTSAAGRNPLRGRAGLVGAAALIAASALVIGSGVSAQFTTAASTAAGGLGAVLPGGGTGLTSTTLTGANAPAGGMTSFTVTRRGTDCVLTWSKVSGPVPDRLQVASGQRTVTTAAANAPGTFTDPAPGLASRQYTATTRRAENWTSPAEQSRVVTCDLGAIADNFNRTGATLLTTSTGATTWEALAGAWSTNGSKATTTADPATSPLATIETGSADVNASVGVGGGDGLVVRASDKDNYIEALAQKSVNTYGAAANSGTRQVANTGWRSVANEKVTYTCYCSPGSGSSYGECPYGGSARGNGKDYWQCVETTYTSEPYTYYTTESYTYYTCGADDALSGTTCTATRYGAIVRKHAAGQASTLWTSPMTPAPVSTLRLVTRGDAIALHLNGAPSPAVTLTEAFNRSATKVGISRGPSQSHASALDDFTVTAA